MAVRFPLLVVDTTHTPSVSFTEREHVGLLPIREAQYLSDGLTSERSHMTLAADDPTGDAGGGGAGRLHLKH